MYNYSVYQLPNGPLAKLPAILDSFFTNTTSDLYGVFGWGVGSHEVAG